MTARRVIRVVPHRRGRRLYVLGRRVHHGSAGCLLIAQGVLWVLRDWRDRPWWPSREGR